MRSGKKNMIYGALWCIGGIVVTAVTYSAASGGGTYIVAWGAIIFGAIQFFYGLMQYSTKREAALDNAEFPSKLQKMAADTTFGMDNVRCPICKLDTILRTVKKGSDAGKQFYVCVKYPECKGRVQVRKKAL